VDLDHGGVGRRSDHRRRRVFARSELLLVREEAQKGGSSWRSECRKRFKTLVADSPNGDRKVREVITMAKTKQADKILANGDAQLGADVQGDVSERAIKVEDFECRRLKYGFGLLLAGLAAILVMFVLVTLLLGDRFDTAASVLSLITTSTTVIGTLVGFYFGAQIGASGFARADINRQEMAQQSQQTARKAVGRACIVVDEQRKRK
jgi:hypothetical protein